MSSNVPNNIREEIFPGVSLGYDPANRGPNLEGISVNTLSVSDSLSVNNIYVTGTFTYSNVNASAEVLTDVLKEYTAGLGISVLNQMHFKGSGVQVTHDVYDTSGTTYGGTVDIIGRAPDFDNTLVFDNKATPVGGFLFQNTAGPLFRARTLTGSQLFQADNITGLTAGITATRFIAGDSDINVAGGIRFRSNLMQYCDSFGTWQNFGSGSGGLYVPGQGIDITGNVISTTSTQVFTQANITNIIGNTISAITPASGIRANGLVIDDAPAVLGALRMSGTNLQVYNGTSWLTLGTSTYTAGAGLTLSGNEFSLQNNISVNSITAPTVTVSNISPVSPVTGIVLNGKTSITSLNTDGLVSSAGTITFRPTATGANNTTYLFQNGFTGSTTGISINPWSDGNIMTFVGPGLNRIRCRINGTENTTFMTANGTTGVSYDYFILGSTANSTAGAMRYNAGVVQVYNGSAWTTLGTSYVAGNGIIISGNSIGLSPDIFVSTLTLSGTGAPLKVLGNMNDNSVMYFRMGKEDLLNNCINMVFFYTSSGSTSNNIGLGFSNNDSIIGIHATRRVTIGTGATPTSVLNIREDTSGVSTVRHTNNNSAGIASFALKTNVAEMNLKMSGSTAADPNFGAITNTGGPISLFVTSSDGSVLKEYRFSVDGLNMPAPLVGTPGSLVSFDNDKAKYDYFTFGSNGPNIAGVIKMISGAPMIYDNSYWFPLKPFTGSIQVTTFGGIPSVSWIRWSGPNPTMSIDNDFLTITFTGTIPNNPYLTGNLVMMRNLPVSADLTFRQFYNFDDSKSDVIFQAWGSSGSRAWNGFPELNLIYTIL